MKGNSHQILKGHLRLILISILVAITLHSFFIFYATSKPSLAPSPVFASSPNPIVVENQQPGSSGWQFDNYNKATHHEIEGYASLTSVNKGGQISFMVSLSSSALFTMDIYRMGYYPNGTNPDGSVCSGSCGGRLMLNVGPLQGATQAACPTITASGNTFGMTECQWKPNYTLTIPTTWTTGNYIVKLRRTDNSLENYMTFVVRDDSSSADIVYSLDVTTWQAYNFWGGAGNKNIGYNLYGKFNDVSLANLTGSRAYAVSFDRPYLDQGSLDGAGNFMLWDYPMIHWMEAQGYNITYVTDVDLESNPSLFNGHKMFMNTGHDEYYSDNMRANLQNAINVGVNMAFFSANNIGYRMTWGNSISGQSYRREFCDKGALPGSTTTWWRYLTPPQPENSITGVLQNGAASDRPFLVYDATSWLYTGTGLVNYTGGTVITSGPGQNAIAGVIGYEFDERAVNDPNLSAFVSYEPAGLQQVGHSFVPASDNGVNAYADTTLYTASSGAIVFAAGTIQWAWGVDNGYNDGFCSCNTGMANSISQIITTNILNRFVGATPTGPGASLSTTSLTYPSQNVGTTSAAQVVTLTNTGTTALTISSIALSGTNASDFAQTSMCPLGPNTLATGASCTISITFTPGAAGARSATLTITDNAPKSPQTVTLAGTGNTSTVYFTDGFESGDFSQWNLNSSDSTGTKTIQTAVVNSGTYAAEFSTGSGQYTYLYTAFSAGPQAQSYTRFYFRFSSLSSSTILAVGRDANNTNVWEIDYDINLHGLDFYYWGNGGILYSLSTAANALSANTWYCIELQDTETTTGQGQAWVNGTSIGVINANLSAANAYAQLMLYDDAVGTLYFDDVQVASTYNGLVH